MVVTGPAISVLTPTYNRAHVLHRTYKSLQNQTMRDFEWVVVDDGSTDETAAMLTRWQAEADFPITWCRYINNRGKNAAVNIGRYLVSGDYTLILDSDDTLLADGLKTVSYWRNKTKIDEIRSVYALMFRCIDENGNIVGKLPCGNREMPKEVMHMSGKEARYKLRMTFDFIGVVKTDIFREREFVELTDAEHGPLTITHSKMSGLYESIYIDHIIRQYFQHDGEPRLSDKAPRKAVKWPRGNYLRALTILNDDIGFLKDSPKIFLNAGRKVTRLGLHIGRSPYRQFGDLAHASARLLWAACIPGGVVGYVRDRLSGRRVPRANPDISAWGPAAAPDNLAFYPAPERFGAVIATIKNMPEAIQ